MAIRGNKLIEISIIIVNWNTKELLLECLSSLLSEAKGKSVEIIVVDNGSSDGSGDAVKEKFPEVRLVSNMENIGFAKANNIGIKVSLGRYVILSNSDVIVREGCIERLHGFMEQNGRIGLLGPKVLNADGTIQRSCTRFPTIWRTLFRALALDNLVSGLSYFPHRKMGEVDALSGCFLMAKKEAIMQIGLLDENYFMYAEDKDWCKRFKEAGWKVVYYPLAEIIHYGGASSLSAPLNAYIRMHEANLTYWKKYHTSSSQRAFYYLLIFHQIIRIMGWKILSMIRRSKKEEIGAKMERHLLCLRWLLNVEYPN